MPPRKHSARGAPGPERILALALQEWDRLGRERIARANHERIEALRTAARQMIPGIEARIQFARERGIAVPAVIQKRLEWLKRETKT